MPGPAAVRAVWALPVLWPLSRPAEPVRVTSSWRPAVWPGRSDEADWGCSPRSWPKVAVRQASARALARAAAVVGPASREAQAARQRRAPPEAQASRAVLQPQAAETVSPAVLQPPAVEALSRFVAAPASVRALRRHNPRSEDRTERPRCALLDSHLTHRSQILPLAEVPHLERSRRSESLRRAHRCSLARALSHGRGPCRAWAQLHAAADRQQHRVQVGHGAHPRLVGHGGGKRIERKEHTGAPARRATRDMPRPSVSPRHGRSRCAPRRGPLVGMSQENSSAWLTIS